MPRAVNPRDVALRIRGLIAQPRRGALESAAKRLGVSAVALRVSIDDVDPHPAIEVLDALVRELGVDPTWLLTGHYDFAAHERAIEGRGEFAESAFAPLLGSAHSDSSRTSSRQGLRSEIQVDAIPLIANADARQRDDADSRDHFKPDGNSISSGNAVVGPDAELPPPLSSKSTASDFSEKPPG